jgi:putative transposase
MVFPIEILQKHYKGLLIEYIYPSGNEFRNTNHKKYRAKEKRLMNLSLMKPKSKQVCNTFGYGFAIETKHRQIHHIDISFERIILVAERFIVSLINTYDKYPVSTDDGTWYPQACKFLKLKHFLHSPFEKSNIERVVQYIKDRTEGFDDYFPCKRKKKCKLKHIRNWFNLFISQHNKQIMH